MEREGSLPCSQEPATGPVHESDDLVHTLVSHLFKIYIVILPEVPFPIWFSN